MNGQINCYSVFDVFSMPTIVRSYNELQWQNIIRVLRSEDLLGSFYYLLAHSQLIDFVPQFALKHLVSAKLYADRQSHQIKNEAHDLHRLLKKISVEPIFLKGAAYVLSEDNNYLGRVMSDIDILVKKEELEHVEAVLRENDWTIKQLDNYDEQYYRKWAHEIPPYTHIYRGTTLDVHHTLLPPITGHIISKAILFNQINQTTNSEFVLSDELKALHSIIHLFFNEDFERSFRNLLDIHSLLNELENRQSLEKFYLLSIELGFSKEIYYTIKLRKFIFNRVPSTHEMQIMNDLTFINAITSDLFTRLVLYRSFMPSHDLVNRPSIRFAKFLMYLRGHLLKMPLRILIPHFIIKMRRAIVMSVYGAHHYEK